MTSNDELRSAIREIARAEVLRTMETLADEIGRTPLRADGGMNARDLHACVSDTCKELRERE